MLKRTLENKRCLVVGGAGGIGRAITEAFLEHGAKVAVVDLSPFPKPNKEPLDFIEDSLYLIERDVTDRNQIDTTIKEVSKKLGGHVEVLVNAAGIQRRNSSEIFAESDWDDVISVNLSSVFFYSQIVALEMLKASNGKIINISSIMSNFGGISIPAYSASKGGVAQLTKAMSNDWAGRGICVNAIAPGYITTPMTEKIFEDSERYQEILNRTPAGRWGKPEDLKGIAVFLASRDSDFITGAVIPVDGGYSAR